MEKALTIEMFMESAVGGVLEDHHPRERLVFLAVTQKIREVLVVDFGQGGDLNRR